MELPAPDANALELKRLDTAVRTLSDRYLAQRDENAKLRGEIEARDRRVEQVESELRRLQQSRRDVVRRIDELIGEIGRLEGRLAKQAPPA